MYPPVFVRLINRRARGWIWIDFELPERMEGGIGGSVSFFAEITRPRGLK